MGERVLHVGRVSVWRMGEWMGDGREGGAWVSVWCMGN